MSGPTYLSDAQFAEYFAEQNAITPGESPVDLEPRVQQFLDRAGMTHRNAFTIAIEVSRLAPEPAPAPVATPEQAAWQVSLAEGIGDQQIPDVASMDWQTYARFRQERGIGAAHSSASTLSFLGGDGARR